MMDFDSTRNRVLLWGGKDARGGYLLDTWEWDGALASSAILECLVLRVPWARQVFDLTELPPLLWLQLLALAAAPAMLIELWKLRGRLRQRLPRPC